MTCTPRSSQPKTSLSLRAFHALFPDEAAARAWFEAARWPDGPVCPRCGATERASWLASRSRWTCRGCKLQYSVMSYTPMHRSHIPLLVWAQAIYLMVTSSKGISALKLSEILGLSYRSAWFLAHRIRAMMAADLEAGSPLLNGLVEIDETYAGAAPRKAGRAAEDGNDGDNNGLSSGASGARKSCKAGRGTSRPMVMVAVERSGHDHAGGRTFGRAYPRPIPTHSRSAIAQALDGMLHPKATIMTDGLPAYKHLGQSHGGLHAHHTVVHSQRLFARTDYTTGQRVHVTTAESWAASLQRAVIGVFHHLSRQHLDRYAIEAAFRWNTRGRSVLDRMRNLVRAAAGFRLSFNTLTAASA